MDTTSLKFTKEEQEIFSDPVFFKRKTHITHVIVSLLGQLNEQLETNTEAQQLITHFNLITQKGKISRGENYLGSPWQLLDYPRIFEKENIFAFRTMCWWGHYYSCTLHLSGTYFKNCLDALLKNLPAINNSAIYICVNDTQWEHHHEEHNYRQLKRVVNDDVLLNRILYSNNFIKLSCKFPLEEIEQLKKNTVECLRLFSKIITHSASDR